MRRIINESGKNIRLADIKGYSRSLPINCLLEDAAFIHYHINGDEYAPPCLPSARRRQTLPDKPRPVLQARREP